MIHRKLEHPEPHRGTRVVVAEDDDAMRDLVAEALKKAGCEVIECPDGASLFEFMREAWVKNDRPPFDLIVSDLRLPAASGFEVLMLVRRLKNPIPVIIVTAFGDELTHSYARELGAAAVLNKPFDLDELVELIGRALDESRGRCEFPASP